MFIVIVLHSALRDNMKKTSKESKGILGCATAKAYKPLVNSVCEPGLKSLFWVPSCQALGLYFAGLYKKTMVC